MHIHTHTHLHTHVYTHTYTELMSKITFVDGERVYRDSDRRHHKSDGIIFQPDRPYTFGRDTDLLKWKWNELRSVDVQVVMSPVTTSGGGGHGSSSSHTPLVRLMCDGPDGSQIDLSKRGRDHIGLGVFDTQRLLADVDEAANAAGAPMGMGGGRPPVVEVAYDASIGLWSYCHLRKDKTTPNFIDTVLGVFVEQAEAISVEELQYKMLAKADADDDYGAQLHKMKGKLLDWQAGKK